VAFVESLNFLYGLYCFDPIYLIFTVVIDLAVPYMFLIRCVGYSSTTVFTAAIAQYHYYQNYVYKFLTPEISGHLLHPPVLLSPFVPLCPPFNVCFWLCASKHEHHRRQDPTDQKV